MTHKAEAWFIFATIIATAGILLIFAQDGVEKSKYAYEISSNKGTWFANDYNQTKGCVNFTQKSNGAEIELCGNYSIIEKGNK